MFSDFIAFCQVMRDAKLSRLEFDRLIHRRLRAVLVSAYRHVLYYRELMHGVGYDPIRDYRGPEDLSKLPITTKKIIKQRELTALVKEGADLSNCYSDVTSGSTGIPLRIHRSPYERAVHIAKWLRVLFVNGYSVRHKVMAVVGPGRVRQQDSVMQHFGLFRRLTVDYVRHSARELVDILLTYKPDVLYGNRAHLDLMALELRRRHVRPQDLGLKLVLGGSEVIHDSSRYLCREQFGVELIEYYGSWEMGGMAYETPAHDGLHLHEDLTYFEFLDEDGNPVPPGTPGRVVVTDLIGKLMPFVRYDQGDWVVFEHAGDVDGTVSRRLMRIIGRDNDFAQMPDGTRIPAHCFNRLIGKYEGIGQFRVVQRACDLFRILIVADTSCFLTVRDDLMDLLRREFPPSVRFEVVQVDHIAPDPNGKLRTLVSEVD